MARIRSPYGTPASIAFGVLSAWAARAGFVADFDVPAAAIAAMAGRRA